MRTYSEKKTSEKKKKYQGTQTSKQKPDGAYMIKSKTGKNILIKECTSETILKMTYNGINNAQVKLFVHPRWYIGLIRPHIAPGSWANCG